jgi:hypothetical protein
MREVVDGCAGADIQLFPSAKGLRSLREKIFSGGNTKLSRGSRRAVWRQRRVYPNAKTSKLRPIDEIQF